MLFLVFDRPGNATNDILIIPHRLDAATRADTVGNVYGDAWIIPAECFSNGLENTHTAPCSNDGDILRCCKTGKGHDDESDCDQFQCIFHFFLLLFDPLS